MNKLRDAVRYSFAPLIQRQMDQFVEEWWCHRIRFSRMTEQPPGILNVIYDYPGLYGKKQSSKNAV